MDSTQRCLRCARRAGGCAWQPHPAGVFPHAAEAAGAALRRMLEGAGGRHPRSGSFRQQLHDRSSPPAGIDGQPPHGEAVVSAGSGAENFRGQPEAIRPRDNLHARATACGLFAILRCCSDRNKYVQAAAMETSAGVLQVGPVEPFMDSVCETFLAAMNICKVRSLRQLYHCVGVAVGAAKEHMTSKGLSVLAKIFQRFIAVKPGDPTAMALF